MNAPRLADRLRTRTPLVGAAVGSGMTAAAAEAGGADFLVVLTSGLFRVQGIGSAAALMPYANANEMTWALAREQVAPRVRGTPIFLGICAQDPALDLDEHLHRAKETGMAGVTNYPTVALLDEPNRAVAEADGVTFAEEVAMLARAAAAGLATLGFCRTPADATALAEAGVDVLCLNLGTASRRALEGAEHQAALDQAVATLLPMVAAARAVRPDACCLVVGGPVVTPQDTALIYQRTQVKGYLGGSAIESFPAAPAITQTVRAFKTVTAGREKVQRLGAMIGASPAMQQVFEAVRAVAATDATVLLIGESGTGKELIARELHRLSARAEKPIATWNCGAISESLAMSELFGHEKGAFTGASRTHIGKFEMATGGTLFMDEVTDLPLSVQASLLRVLQQQELVRVGGERTLLVDVRVIAASNKEFTELIPAGRFRLDLYYRLSTVIIRVPPLRERLEDIPHLIREIGQELAQRYGRPAPRIPDATLGLFLRHRWPGNIRELRNGVERLFLLDPGSALSRAWLEEMLAADRAIGERLAPPSSPFLSIEAKRGRLAEVLARHDGNRTAAARELGVTRKTIHKWLREKGE